MRIEPDHLVRATGCRPSVAMVFAEHIDTAIVRHGVKHIAAFIAQMAHESQLFTKLEEDLVYRTPERLIQIFGSRYFPSIEFASQYVNAPEKLANYVYDDRNPARRNKLGNVRDGDGWRHRGRGLKHLTGRDNYQAYQNSILEVDVMGNPDLMLVPAYAADSAGWFWRTNDCDSVAHDPRALTKRVNGGTIGLQQRIALMNRTESVFVGFA